MINNLHQITSPNRTLDASHHLIYGHDKSPFLRWKVKWIRPLSLISSPINCKPLFQATMKATLILLFLAVLGIVHSQDSITVLVSNSYSNNCQFPVVPFVPFVVESNSVAKFWGSANAGATYSPSQNELVFQCLGVFGCISSEQFFSEIIQSINMVCSRKKYK